MTEDSDVDQLADSEDVEALMQELQSQMSALAKVNEEIATLKAQASSLPETEQITETVVSDEVAPTETTSEQLPNPEELTALLQVELREIGEEARYLQSLPDDSPDDVKADAAMRLADLEKRIEMVGELDRLIQLQSFLLTQEQRVNTESSPLNGPIEVTSEDIESIDEGVTVPLINRTSLSPSVPREIPPTDLVQLAEIEHAASVSSDAAKIEEDYPNEEVSPEEMEEYLALLKKLDELKALEAQLTHLTALQEAQLSAESNLDSSSGMKTLESSSVSIPSVVQNGTPVNPASIYPARSATVNCHQSEAVSPPPVPVSSGSKVQSPFRSTVRTDNLPSPQAAVSNRSHPSIFDRLHTGAKRENVQLPAVLLQKLPERLNATYRPIERVSPPPLTGFRVWTKRESINKRCPKDNWTLPEVVPLVDNGALSAKAREAYKAISKSPVKFVAPGKSSNPTFSRAERLSQGSASTKKAYTMQSSNLKRKSRSTIPLTESSGLLFNEAGLSISSPQLETQTTIAHLSSAALPSKLDSTLDMSIQSRESPNKEQVTPLRPFRTRAQADVSSPQGIPVHTQDLLVHTSTSIDLGPAVAAAAAVVPKKKGVKVRKTAWGSVVRTSLKPNALEMREMDAAAKRAVDATIRLPEPGALQPALKKHIREARDLVAQKSKKLSRNTSGGTVSSGGNKLRGPDGGVSAAISAHGRAYGDHLRRLKEQLRNPHAKNAPLIRTPFDYSYHFVASYGFVDRLHRLWDRSGGPSSGSRAVSAKMQFTHRSPARSPRNVSFAEFHANPYAKGQGEHEDEVFLRGSPVNEGLYGCDIVHSRPSRIWSPSVKPPLPRRFVRPRSTRSVPPISEFALQHFPKESAAALRARVVADEILASSAPLDLSLSFSHKNPSFSSSLGTAVNRSFSHSVSPLNRSFNSYEGLQPPSVDTLLDSVGPLYRTVGDGDVGLLSMESALNGSRLAASLSSAGPCSGTNEGLRLTEIVRLSGAAASDLIDVHVELPSQDQWLGMVVRSPYAPLRAPVLVTGTPSHFQEASQVLSGTKVGTSSFKTLQSSIQSRDTHDLRPASFALTPQSQLQAAAIGFTVSPAQRPLSGQDSSQIGTQVDDFSSGRKGVSTPSSPVATDNLSTTARPSVSKSARRRPISPICLPDFQEVNSNVSKSPSGLADPEDFSSSRVRLTFTDDQSGSGSLSQLQQNEGSQIDLWA